jgi:hypothetical protein
MKLFWIGCAVGIILGGGVAVVYLSLATLFSANSKASLAQSKAARALDQHSGDAKAAEDKTSSVGA